ERGQALAAAPGELCNQLVDRHLRVAPQTGLAIERRKPARSVSLDETPNTRDPVVLLRIGDVTEHLEGRPAAGLVPEVKPGGRQGAEKCLDDTGSVLESRTERCEIHRLE